MQKRMLLCILIIGLFINVGGCTSTQSAAPKTAIQHTAAKPLEKFDEAVGRDKTDKAGSKKADTEDLKGLEDLEMKHWKYNRDLEAARKASQQSQQTQSAIASTGQNASDPNAGKNIGQGSYSNNTGSYTPTRIDFITEDDFKEALSQLIKLGYLDAASSNEQSFKAALIQFQKDQGLKASGQLDVETIKSFDANANH